MLTFAVAVVALAAAATAAWLFPRALPIVALEQSVTRDIALTRADSFFRAHGLAPANARTAVRFRGDDSLRTFVELAGGGKDSLEALVQGRDVAPFIWSVRAFVPGNPREARVDFAPDGRIIGFSQTLAESDSRPSVAADSARRLAENALVTWIGERMDRWRLVSSSYETRKLSGRVDHTFTYERTGRSVGGAPIRTTVIVAGNAPTRVRPFVEIPESFRRRYGEMRSANELLGLIAGIGLLAIAIAGIVFLSRSVRARSVRWRESMMAGAVIGALAIAAGLNEMPGSWFGYDTATSPTTFQTMIALGALLLGGLTGAVTGFTLAAAESATRQAFPNHLDWWKLWKYRGTRPVAARVAGGYAVAATAFAYVAIFYLVTRSLLGWWVPSVLLDDPNQIASPMPWISGIAISVNAGVWEEALFRALPLSLLSLFVGQRTTRKWWMTGGVIVSALIFGFAHSSYESWPPYSRGVEIFLDACFWGVLFLSFGFIVTVIAHFAYDLVLFGLFAASGSAVQYRISAAIILLALLAPALAVAWQWIKQRGLIAAPADAYFSAWVPGITEPATTAHAPLQAHALSKRARAIAAVAVIAAAIVAVALPPRPTLGPPFSVERSGAIAVADSMLRERGVDPSAWTRLARMGTDTLPAWSRFAKEYNLIPQAKRLASTHLPPAWWVVRYVHATGSAAQRTEEWRVRVSPNGTPLGVRHLIPDSAHRNHADAAGVRRIALAALEHDGIDTTKLQETEFKETARPARRDVLVTYTDTSVKLPAGAAARAWVQVAGDEPLVARRGVELPEKFLRADRDRQTNLAVIAGFCALLLLGGIVFGTIVIIRRRPLLLSDGTLDRRGMIIFVSTLIILGVLERLNSLPRILSDYDTSVPWSRFIGSTTLGFVGVIPLALIVLGVWLVLNALRRRVGIPMLSGTPSAATSNTMLIAGLGLGGVVFASTRLGAFAQGKGLPEAPTSQLGLGIPILGDIPSIPQSAVMAVALVAVPILIAVGITTRWTLRVIILAVAATLVGALVIALAPPADMRLTGVIGLVICVAAVVLAFRAWGGVCAWSWIVAALAFGGLSSLRSAVYAPTMPEHVEGVLSLLVACALVTLIARVCRSSTGQSISR